MSLIKRGNSKFWYVQFQLNHQTIIRSTRTTDRKAAEKIAVKIRAEAHDQIILGRKKPLTLEKADGVDAPRRHRCARMECCNHSIGGVHA